jgi:ribonucleotide reductase alpha subunit
MNKVIDLTYYPTEEGKLSNMRHRPLGIGIQGLHDTFILLKMPFSSPEARELNKRISETIYYGTLTGSNELAKKDGAYETFKDSPASQGKLQFDLWDMEKLDKLGVESGEIETEPLNYNWAELKESIAKYGLRNSMLTTCMPTASSAQILGNCESIEPFDSCIFKRRVLSGEYIIVNKHLLRDLTELKLWNKELKDQIILNNGSVQNIPNIPDKIKKLYKTVWEMSMKDIITLSADRGRFIDHTQSLNLFMADPTISKLTSMHFFAWKKHLKTGIYYLRSKESSGGAKFSVDPEIEKTHNESKLNELNELSKLQCSIDNKEDCMMCSS